MSLLEQSPFHSSVHAPPQHPLAIRNAEQDDVRDLTSSISNTGGLGFYKATFGTFHLPTVLDYSHLSLVAHGPSNEDHGSHIEGFVVINDSISIINEQQSFEKVIEMLKYYIPVTANNTMFINFWLINGNPHLTSTNAQIARDEAIISKALIEEIFARCPHLDFLVWLTPSSFILSEQVQLLFSTISPEDIKTSSTLSGESKAAEGSGSGYTKPLLHGLKVFFLHRSRFLPRLLVRPARVQDNDDLLPIISATQPQILQGQDSYFLANLINSADENNQFFVGLKDQYTPVGFLATSLDVNMGLIMKIFDVDPYSDLILYSDYVPPPPPLLIALLGDLRLLDMTTLYSSLLINEHVLLIDLEHHPVDWKRYLDTLGPQDYSQALRSYIREILANEGGETAQQAVQAIILLGLPANEEEARKMMSTMEYELDFIYELVNLSEEVDEEDENDLFLQRHLDGVEVLRETFFSHEEQLSYIQNAGSVVPGAGAASRGKRAQWKKLSLDKETAVQLKTENIQRFHHVLLQVALEERTERMLLAKSIQQEKPPKANGFAITALCLQEKFTSRSMDLLKLAFEEQPAYNYCVYMIPNDTANSSGSAGSSHALLATHCFSFIKTRPGISFDQSLYLIHRSYFKAAEHLSLHRLTHSLLVQDVQAFLQPLGQLEKNSIIDHCQEALLENDIDAYDNPACIAFAIMLTEKHMIGMIVLSRKLLTSEDVHWFRTHYHLEDSINFGRHRLKNHSFIQHYVIDPIFSGYTRQIMSSVMRLCMKSIFYYHAPERDLAPPKEILEDFTFIRPRRTVQGDHQAYRVRPSSLPGKDGKPAQVQGVIPRHDSPLYLLTKATLHQVKTIVPQRLVIVGGAPHAYGLLETFLSVPNLYYPNIYFINGILPSPLRANNSNNNNSNNSSNNSGNNSNNNSMILEDNNSILEDDLHGCLTAREVDYPLLPELWAMSYAHRVNILRGHLTDIDRDHQAVVISDELVVEYDYLVLSTSTVDHSSRKINPLQGVHPMKCADAGIFSLGNPTSDLLALQFCKKRFASVTAAAVAAAQQQAQQQSQQQAQTPSAASNPNPNPIIISGTALKVLTAAEGLIRHAGIDASRIIGVVSDAGPKQIGGLVDAPVMELIAQSAQIGGLKKFLWNSFISDIHFSRNGFIASVDIQTITTTEVPATGPGAAGNAASAAAANTATVNSAATATGTAAGQAAGTTIVQTTLTMKENCTALLLCGETASQSSCERDVYAAINDCGLVFDGGLIVDLTFRTVDTHIYAISDYTKFSRIHRNELPHRAYNPREMGMYVAMTMISKHFHPHPQELTRFQSKLLSSEHFTAGEEKSAGDAMSKLGGTNKRGKPLTRPMVRFHLPRASYSLLPGEMSYFTTALPYIHSKDVVSYLTDNHAAFHQQNGQQHELTSASAAGLLRVAIDNNSSVSATNAAGSATAASNGTVAATDVRRITALRTSSLGIFQEMTYVGMDTSLEVRNFASIPGRHESFFNAAIHAYEAGYILDWIDFLRQEWTTVVYMDSFQHLIQALRKNLAADKGMIVLLSRIFERSEITPDDTDVAHYRRSVLGAHGELIPELTYKNIESTTMEFIREHGEFLPKYYIQSQHKRDGAAGGVAGGGAGGREGETTMRSPMNHK